MLKFVTSLVSAIMIIGSIYGQEIMSPSAFLGYEMGTEFTYHHRALDYFKYVDESSDKVIYERYGTSYEGRELAVVFISSPENLTQLESFRRNNISKTGLEDYAFEGRQLPFIWLSYNIHGNESNGMEAALEVLYTLVSGSYEGVDDWLQSCIIIIDPCLNPDGRERYTLNYRMMQSRRVNPDPNSWERSAPWPGSRSNHYFFDLNRDWTWQTQTESQQRLAFYHRYMPHVHADFHEMGPNSDYFFPPGADPWHNAITSWQREFHQLTGEANAALFNEKYRLYYSGEIFDLFGPSYGDTWPLFNGAMGFTYEQGGSGRAGLAVIRNLNDTLTLKHRIEGHFLASMATIKVAYDHRDRLITGFNNYFETARTNPPFEYKSIIVKVSNPTQDIRDLLHLLDKNKIRYHYADPVGRRYRGLHYLSGQEADCTIEQGDILIPANQPQGHFVKVLFEPRSEASDSLSYDLTAWSLPYLYNLESYAIRERIPVSGMPVLFNQHENELPANEPYAYLVEWKSFLDAKFLAGIYQHNVHVRNIMQPLSMNGHEFGRGSLVIARGDNRHIPDLFDQIVVEAANETGVVLHTTNTGMADTGIDLGSVYAHLNRAPSIVTIGGNNTAAGPLGEMRYFFDQELDYPLTIIDSGRFGHVDLSEYDILILNPGDHTRFKEQIMGFIRQGGRVLAMDRATTLFGSDENTALGKATAKRQAEQGDSGNILRSDDPSLLTRFEDSRRHMLSERSAGAIYKVRLDDSHPYTFGMRKQWFIMKRSEGLPLLQSGHNIGFITDSEPVAGFAGYKFQEHIKNTLVLGAERIGRGEVIYISDNPYFRAYWKSSRLLLGNILLKDLPRGYSDY